MLALPRSRLPAARNVNNTSRLIPDAPQQHYRRPRPANPDIRLTSLSLSPRLRFKSNFAPRLGPGAPRLFSTAFQRGEPSLAGTAPYHTAYVLLHTHAPPADYPPKSKSPLWRAFTLRARQWGGVVNFAWAPGGRQAVHPVYAGLGEASDRGSSSPGQEEEAYVASVFSSAHPAGRFVIPEVTLANLDAVDARLRALVCGEKPEGLRVNDDPEATVAVEEVEGDGEKLFLYVCTHGSRDCRCGDSGGAVARALQREIDRRGLAEDVFLGEVAHVGGHKWAANILVYPSGEWLGSVQDSDVPQIVDELVAWHASHRHTTSSISRPPLCPRFWRGRMGLDKEEQIAFHSTPVGSQ
ncbi:Sucrase/ferredoxin-like-domain-containing protein [Ganoderma leucocontextum]|nr:Sucrase/ferredoxin-like-domain-containing protein [Ganoderma leucocontextum]